MTVKHEVSKTIFNKLLLPHLLIILIFTKAPNLCRKNLIGYVIYVCYSARVACLLFSRGVALSLMESVILSVLSRHTINTRFCEYIKLSAKEGPALSLFLWTSQVISVLLQSTLSLLYLERTWATLSHSLDWLALEPALADYCCEKSL